MNFLRRNWKLIGTALLSFIASLVCVHLHNVFFRIQENAYGRPNDWAAINTILRNQDSLAGGFGLASLMFLSVTLLLVITKIQMYENESRFLLSYFPWGWIAAAIIFEIGEPLLNRSIPHDNQVVDLILNLSIAFVLGNILRQKTKQFWA